MRMHWILFFNNIQQYFHVQTLDLSTLLAKSQNIQNFGLKITEVQITNEPVLQNFRKNSTLLYISGFEFSQILKVIA